MRPERKIWNERIKLFANFLNAVAIGVIAFSFIRPSIDDGIEQAYFVGLMLGVIIHAAAQFVLGSLIEEK